MWIEWTKAEINRRFWIFRANRPSKDIDEYLKRSRLLSSIAYIDAHSIFHSRISESRRKRERQREGNKIWINYLSTCSSLFRTVLFETMTIRWREIFWRFRGSTLFFDRERFHSLQIYHPLLTRKPNRRDKARLTVRHKPWYIDGAHRRWIDGINTEASLTT